MDLIYGAIGIVFFLSTVGLMNLCEVLGKSGPGGRS
jgi:hypothetical protein